MFDEPVPELIDDQLRRILSSCTFKRSERSRQLLSYLVRQTVSGTANTVKEYTIGTDVFGKAESFDPRTDPMVRVEARRLRSKLDRYYRLEAQDDPILIELIHGSYVPLFRAHEHGNGAGNGEPRTRIAILPVYSLGRSTKLGYFTRGLSAELLHGLSGLREVRILAYENQLVPADKMRIHHWAKRVGAHWLVECTVRQERRRFRVSAQLTKVGDASLHWSEMLDSAVGSQIHSQQQIALAIVRGICTALSLAVAQPSPKPAASARPSGSGCTPEALVGTLR